MVSMIKKKILCLTIVLFLVFVSSNARANDQDIYVLLIQQSDYVIPSERDHCEIVTQPLSVCVYLSSYLEFVNSNPQRMHVSFNCDAQSDDINCSLNYGQTAKWSGHEGWDRILRFKYDFETKIIDESTFACIDVP